MSDVFEVRQDGGLYDAVNGLSKAVDLAEVLLGGVDQSEPSTFTVHDASGAMIASVTNRRIMGTFTKQRWGGHDGDRAIEVEPIKFDATESVMRLQYPQLALLVDCDYSTDDIGLESIQWDGPFEVEVVDSICEYFGVGSLSEITQKAFEFAVARVRPKQPVAQSITLTIQVDLELTGNASVDDFFRDCEYSVVSKTPGVRVVSLDASIEQSIAQ